MKEKKMYLHLYKSFVLYILCIKKMCFTYYLQAVNEYSGRKDKTGVIKTYIDSKRERILKITANHNVIRILVFIARWQE